MIYDVASFSEIGPRPSNEDAFGYWSVGNTLYAAVADGLGGMGGGGVASNYVIDFMRSNLTEEDISALQLSSFVYEAHISLVGQQSAHPNLRSMATTLTIIALKNNQLLAAHCGDTRLYLARGNGIKKLSEDHSEGQRLYKEGLLTKRELIEYPRKNILDSALGVSTRPIVQQIECQMLPGDWVVITSDGAHDKLTTEEMRNIGKSTDRADKFADEARYLIERRFPRDNYTFVVVKINP